MNKTTLSQGINPRQTVLTCAMVSCLVAVPLEASAQFVYTGVNNTTMQFPDLYGNPSPPQSFRTNAIISFDAPLQVFDPFTGVVTQESNPFNLFIGFPPAEAASTGALSIFSAVETSALSGGTFLQQFWQLELIDDFTFQGVFTDSQFGNLANQPNLINAPYPLPGGINIGAFPFALAPGTQLVGQFSSDFSQVRVQVSGNTTDLGRPFFADLTAAFSAQTQQDAALLASDAAPPVLTFPPKDPRVLSSKAAEVPEPNAIGGLALVVILAGFSYLKKG